MECLCQYCAALFPIDTARGKFSVTHHPNVAELLRSAETCRLCKTIQHYWSLDDLMHRFSELTEENFSSLSLYFHLQDPGVLAHSGSWALLAGTIKVPSRTSFNDFSLSITTHCEPSGDNPLWQGRESSPSEKYAAIREWFCECRENHPDCIPATPKFPTRLIDVGSGDTPPRLIHTAKGIKEDAQYATLSHCWGNYRPLTTTQENIDALTQEIPFGSLPKTFCEAIIITRELDIPYIWIDSLCIIQDDDEDWCREAALMKHTYSCSAITIGASDARNSLQGCFVDKRFDAADPQRYQIHQFTIQPDEAKAAFQVRIHGGDIRNRVSGTKLSTRGWNLQEQVLSHRVIHCMRPELHWQCRLKYRTESGVVFSGREYKRSWTHSLPENASPGELHALWCTWMEDYSQRHFTFEKDWLGALAGITHQYAMRSGHTPVLACWEETLIPDLIWIRKGELVDPAMALPEVPSWSWISRCAGVLFDFWCRMIPKDRIVKVEDRAKAVHSRITWKGAPVVSDLKGTELILEGPVKQLRLRVDTRNPEANPAFITVNNEEFDFSKNPIPWRCRGQFDMEHEREDDIFECLLLRTVEAKGREEGTTLLQETFLILLPVPETRLRDTYRRVGLAVVRGSASEFVGADHRQVRLI